MYYYKKAYKTAALAILFSILAGLIEALLLIVL